MTTVLLAVDETAESTDAVRQARDLFGPEATYLAVNVAESAPRWAPMPMAWGMVYPYPFGADVPDVRSPLDGPTEALDEARETALEVVGEAGVAAAPVGELGDPSTAILEAAERHAADVIVVGSTHKGWWRRLFEGSVSREIADRSPVPVLLAGQHAEADG